MHVDLSRQLGLFTADEIGQQPGQASFAFPDVDTKTQTQLDRLDLARAKVAAPLVDLEHAQQIANAVACGAYRDCAPVGARIKEALADEGFRLDHETRETIIRAALQHLRAWMDAD